MKVIWKRITRSLSKACKYVVEIVRIVELHDIFSFDEADKNLNPKWKLLYAKITDENTSKKAGDF